MRRTIIYLLIACAVSFTLKASESESGFNFKHFKLTPRFSAKSNPIFDKIINFLVPNYQSIGHKQAKSIIEKNMSFDLGSNNYSGFQWQKPMGNFTIAVDRQLEPDLYDDYRWIVSDKFILIINAYTFLHNLSDIGVIDITQKQLASFAGMQFRREYRYIHFADNFTDGLTLNFDKLFLSFLQFQNLDLAQISPYELITKEDSFKTDAGIALNIPLYQGVSGNAGAMHSSNKISSVSIHSLGPNDNPNDGEFLRVSLVKEHKLTNTALGSLQIDFFNLLKLSLLSFEYEYTFSNTSKLNLSFYERDKHYLAKDSPLGNAMINVLSFNDYSHKVLEPYTVSEETRTEENINSQYSALIFGKIKKKNTEQINIQKNGIVKTFYKNHSENIKYARSVLSTIFNALIASIFQSETLSSTYLAERLRNIQFEYEESMHTPHFKEVVIDSEDKMSLQIKHEFSINAKKTLLKKKFRKYAIHFIESFTNLPIEIINKIKENYFISPTKISTKIRINREGLIHFNNSDKRIIKEHLSNICKYHPKRNMKFWHWFSRKKVRAYRCFKRLSSKYNQYIHSYKEAGIISLKKLKNFLITLNKYSDHKDDLKRVFGTNNVFYNGTFYSFTKEGFPFVTHFREGEFTGLGVIDNYLHNN